MQKWKDWGRTGKLNPMQVCKFGLEIVLHTFLPHPPNLNTSCYVKNTTNRIYFDSIQPGFCSTVCLTSTENICSVKSCKKSLRISRLVDQDTWEADSNVDIQSVWELISIFSCFC